MIDGNTQKQKKVKWGSSFSKIDKKLKGGYTEAETDWLSIRREGQ